MRIYLKRLISIRNIILVLILIYGAHLRFQGLASRDIWYDEALDIKQSEKSLLEITKDVPTPVHYYIVHFFLNFGKNTFILGFPSAVFGIISIILIYLIGKKLDGHVLGLVSAFLLSISPMHVEFSQQILHYSYFFTFSLLSVYLFLMIISLFWKTGELKFIPLFLWLSVNILNILTHVSAFIVIAIEIIFLLVILILKIKFLIKYKRYLAPCLVILLLLILFILSVGEGYYFKLFSKYISFNTDKPIELGYSLSKQLNSSTLIFNKEFFESMFSWFGISGGFGLELYFSLSIIGCLWLLAKRKFMFFFFLVSWIIYPFLQLYFVRPSHWFEEKYFIFIIPSYLLLISCGIVFVSDLLYGMYKFILDYSKINFAIFFNSKTKRIIKLSFILFILFKIWTFSQVPLKSKTTFGFPVPGYEKYSWRKVVDYLNKKIKPGDRLFVRSGEEIFLDFYYGSKSKGTLWFDESQFMSLSSEDYNNFIARGNKDYFITIPEIQDVYISGAVKTKSMNKIGNFNIYYINFIRNSPVKIVKDDNGNWEYYDDFRTSKFYADAKDWRNVGTSYLGNFNLPMTYGYFSLYPTGSDVNYIDYKFEFTDSDFFFLKPYFTLEKDITFKVSCGTSNSDLQTIYEIKSDKLGVYDPFIKVDNYFCTGREAYFRFEFKKERNVSFGSSSIKSIYFSSDIRSGAYLLIPSSPNTIIYDSELEVKRNIKWIYDTVQHDSWIQATNGILFNRSLSNETSSLIYKFNLSLPVNKITLVLKSYTSSNSLDVSYSEDYNLWTPISSISDNGTKSHQFDIFGISGDVLYVKFSCQSGGSTCQIRDLKVVN